MHDEKSGVSQATGIDDDNPKGAGVRFPPPLIFLLCLFASIGLQWVLQLDLGIPEPLNLLGLIFVVIAIAIMTVTALAFRRAHTAIEPWKPTSTMLYSGCYAFSRNPIYLSFCLCLFGLGIAANNIWLLLSFIPCGIAIYYVAIAREEAYLERKFGEEYLQFKRRVRRWL